MAKGISKYLFLSCLFSILTVYSAGTLVGFSYDARKSNTISSSIETISFLKLNKVSPSQIRVFVADHSALDSLSNTSVSVDLYLSETHIENLKIHNPSTISWLKTHLITFLPKVKIKSIIISGNRNDLPGQKLLSTLKSIHSIITRICPKSQVTVSVSFSLSFLENLNRKQEKDLHEILNFIKKACSFVVVEARIDDALSMGDRFVESAIKRANSVASVIPFGANVPIVLTIKSPAVPSGTEVAEFSDKISRSLEISTQTLGNLIGLFAEMSPVNEFEQKELEREEEQMFHSSHRELLLKTTLHDIVEPPTTSFPPTPITNPTTPPVTIPPENNPTPTIVTVPSTNPAVPFPYTTPTPTPYNDPVNSPVPLTNPVTTPITVPGGAQPITNPVTTYPAPTGGVPVTTPVTTPVAPPATTNAPAVPGQSWCVAKAGALESALQSALDYACGMGGADCSMIQQGASCYNPDSLQSHASYAFNSYYQKNPTQTSCDFGGTGMITNINPSSGSCIYPTSSSSSTPTTFPTPTPTPTTFPTPTPTTTTASSGAPVPGYGSPPTVVNTSNPALGTTITNPASGTTTVFESPPGATNSTSISANLQPSIGVILITSIITGIFVLDM
ncbi:uncharacterized protein LOC132299530 [Cornus florida]|uniref:uncharacterized protein LOC132299530 n=1 Tax=Cornus florida TaxID=4283 RepID=UPI00289F30C3|nr:uncharacterized protein LOC132299530 [Cornus florida]